MMKYFFLTLILCLTFFNLEAGNCSELDLASDIFHDLKTETEEDNFIKKYESVDCPGIQGYVTALQMKKAERVFFPWSKFNIAVKNKKKINQLIKTNPTNVHLRYIRLMILEKAPKFFSDKDIMSEDKKYLEKVLNTEVVNLNLKNNIKKNTSI